MAGENGKSERSLIFVPPSKTGAKELFRSYEPLGANGRLAKCGASGATDRTVGKHPQLVGLFYFPEVPRLKRILLSTLLLTTAALAQTANVAQTASVKNGVKFTLAQDLIKRSVVGGKTVEEVVKSPKTVIPGDILSEEVTLQNVSGKALSQVLVGIPVPKGTEFSGNVTPDSDRWKVQYSTDSGKTYSPNPMKTVTVTENGKSVTKQVPAPTNTYTNVRWTVTNLKVDETLKLGFRVKVK